MVTVFAEGLRPSVGVGCVKAAFAGVSPGVSAGYSLAIKKTRLHLLFYQEMGAVLVGVMRGRP